jgi:hypothetical protein
MNIIQIISEDNTVNEELPMFGKGNIEYKYEGKKFNLAYNIKEVHPTPLFRNKQWLLDEYVEKGRPMQSIADEFGVSAMAICHWLQKHNIDTRPRGRFAKD